MVNILQALLIVQLNGYWLTNQISPVTNDTK